jgi:hypothetical protein
MIPITPKQGFITYLMYMFGMGRHRFPQTQTIPLPNTPTNTQTIEHG